VIPNQLSQIEPGSFDSLTSLVELDIGRSSLYANLHIASFSLGTSKFLPSLTYLDLSSNFRLRTFQFSNQFFSINLNRNKMVRFTKNLTLKNLKYMQVH
jgi:hypothetical protein